jgi:hypothetical protein
MSEAAPLFEETQSDPEIGAPEAPTYVALGHSMIGELPATLETTGGDGSVTDNNGNLKGI